MVYLRGTVKDLISVSRAVQIASTAGKVVNLLNVDTPAAKPQILLKVRLRAWTAAKRSTWASICSISDWAMRSAVFQRGSFLRRLSAGGTRATFSGEREWRNGYQMSRILLAFFPGLNAGVTIAALETQGIVRGAGRAEHCGHGWARKPAFWPAANILIRPCKGPRTVPGRSRSMFKEYGVRLNFIPTIMPNGTIRLQVAPEVSALDFGDAVEDFRIQGASDHYPEGEYRG